jgi:hypothetical protein
VDGLKPQQTENNIENVPFDKASCLRKGKQPSSNGTQTVMASMLSSQKIRVKY